MVVKEEKPVTMAEVVSLVGDSEKAEQIKSFIKKFNKMETKKAIQMKGELKDLDLIKLKESHIVKIVDFIPKDASELSKVLIEVSLDSDEIAKILEITGRY